jgi:hypothetical protein
LQKGQLWENWIKVYVTYIIEHFPKIVFLIFVKKLEFLGFYWVQIHINKSEIFIMYCLMNYHNWTIPHNQLHLKKRNISSILEAPAMLPFSYFASLQESLLQLPTALFSCACFGIWHRLNYIQYMLLCVWLFLLNNTFVKFIHSIVCICGF